MINQRAMLACQYCQPANSPLGIFVPLAELVTVLGGDPTKARPTGTPFAFIAWHTCGPLPLAEQV